MSKGGHIRIYFDFCGVVVHFLGNGRQWWISFGWWWVVVDIFWLVVGGGGWRWTYFGWWWVLVDGGWWWTYFGCWWVVVDGGGWLWVVVDIFWIVVGRGGLWWIVSQFSLTCFGIFFSKHSITFENTYLLYCRFHCVDIFYSNKFHFFQ